MLFHFNVTLTDKDYLDYNAFWTLKSPYGKKQSRGLKIFIIALFSIMSLYTLISDGLSLSTYIRVIVYLLVMSLFLALYNPFFVHVLNRQIKSLKKQGKMAYSPVAEMEFYDEYFTETTPENKTEQKYSAVERVSILADKTVFIHVNTIMSYILPSASFESSEQYESFIDFIKTKCASIDTY